LVYKTKILSQKIKNDDDSETLLDGFSWIPFSRICHEGEIISIVYDFFVITQVFFVSILIEFFVYDDRVVNNWCLVMHQNQILLDISVLI